VLGLFEILFSLAPDFSHTPRVSKIRLELERNVVKLLIHNYFKIMSKKKIFYFNKRQSLFAQSLILFLSLFFSQTKSEACNFCMLGQGISPYLIADGKGLTLDVNSTISDKVYDHQQLAPQQNEKESWLIYTLTGFYSLSDRWNVMVSLPYSSKTNIDYDADTNSTPGTITNGVGDATVSARYTILSDHSLTHTFLVGTTGGVKFPTGSTHDYTVTGDPVDRHALPGTGSFDFLLGLNSAFSFGGDWQITADVIYAIAGNGNWAGDPHRYGNGLNYELRGFYQFLFVGVSGESIGEEKGVRTDTAYFPDELNLSSGGTVLYADIGIHKSLSAETIVDLRFSKSFYHNMNYDINYDPDPAENYKLDFSVTYLF
jgi:hypothetical protein